MSIVVTELGKIFHRSLFVATDRTLLLDQLQLLGQELGAFGQGQNLDFNLVAPKEGPLPALISARLGIRGDHDFHWMVFGQVLDDTQKESRGIESLASFCDSLWIVSDSRPSSLDKVLKFPWDLGALQKPTLFHVSESPSPANLAFKATQSWYRQQWPHGLFVEKPDQLFPRGMEWILSF